MVGRRCSPSQRDSWSAANAAKLRRLFAEGDFTATHKFALIIALADLAVESSGRCTLEAVLPELGLATTE